MSAWRKSVMALCLLLGVAWSPVVQAQQWVDGRSDPGLREVVAVDETGEELWPFGREDLRGDGYDTFEEVEQQADFRSIYAATDANRLLLRLYVSDPMEVGDAVEVYLFFDSDLDQSTGGPADESLDMVLGEDASDGGYEFAVGLDGAGEVLGLWDWESQPGRWARRNNVPQGQLSASVGVSQDPVLVNEPNHGYVQLELHHATSGLSRACQALIYAKSWRRDEDFGDQRVGDRFGCLSVDSDGDRVADVVDEVECTADRDCPGDGRCVEERCVAGSPCSADADCADDESCEGGQCRYAGGGSCSSASDCDGYPCRDGSCAACESDSDCADGRVCAPSGACVASESDRIYGYDENGDPLVGRGFQGGACVCALPGSGGGAGGGALGLLCVAMLGLVVRRRRAEERGEAIG